MVEFDQEFHGTRILLLFFGKFKSRIYRANRVWGRGRGGDLEVKWRLLRGRLVRPEWLTYKGLRLPRGLTSWGASHNVEGIFVARQTLRRALALLNRERILENG